jgi:hypothetical protein
MHSRNLFHGWWLLAIVFALLLIAAACGDDADSDSASTTTASPATTSATTAADPDDGGSGDAVDASAADSTIEVIVTAGSASGDTGRQEVAVGDTVVVRITSDEAEEVHVHGYDHVVEVIAGETAEIQFTADIPGVFEIELEGSGLLLAELAVS